MVVPAAVLAVAAVGGSCGHSFAVLRIQEDGTHPRSGALCSYQEEEALATAQLVG